MASSPGEQPMSPYPSQAQPRTQAKAGRRAAVTTCAAMIFLAAAGWPFPEGAVKAQTQPTGERMTNQTVGATTEQDQTDLSVTVYNADLALVRDVRQIRLGAGVAPLRFED